MKPLPPPSRPDSVDVNPDRPTNLTGCTTNSPQKSTADRQVLSQHSKSKSKSKSGSLSSLAASALDKTTSAIANISQSVRIIPPDLCLLVFLGPAATNHEIQSPPTESSASPTTLPDRTARRQRHPSIHSASSSVTLSHQLEGRRSSQSLHQRDNPPSQPYGETDRSAPEPVRFVSSVESKMHQTSSRLLRMTDDERPFTKVRGNPWCLHPPLLFGLAHARVSRPVWWGSFYPPLLAAAAISLHRLPLPPQLPAEQV